MARIVLIMGWFVLLLPFFGELSHGSEGGNQELVTLTVNATCEANASLTEKDLTLKDKIVVTISERSTYRVVATDGAFWQLEFVGTKNSISVTGGGSFTTPGGSASWSYSTNTPSIPTALAGVGINGKLGDPGTGTLSLNNFVGQLRIEANHDAAAPLAREIANMAAGFATSSVQADMAGIPSNEQFHKGLAFSFDPNAKRITASGQATYQFPFKQGNQGGTGTVSVSYHVASVNPELEAVLVPKGDYSTWLPVATGKKADIPGNAITFTVELRTTAGESKEKTAQFEIELLDTSRHPGATMNSPWTGVDPDLKILKVNNPALLEISADGQKAKTTKGLKSAAITVSSFDGAAIGRLSVLALIDGENTVINAHLDGDLERTEVSIPYDSDGNTIADSWEKENHIQGKSLDTDEDAEPQGDGHNGDGLTVWEEYRGFLEDGKHIRTNPQQKDLFICDTYGGRSKRGINRFAALTKLAVHDKLTLEELSPSRVINRNRGEDATHVVDQHGLLLDGFNFSGQDYAGYAVPVPGMSDDIGTPKSTERIILDRKLPDTVTRTLVEGTTQAYEYFARVVAHELLHCCNVWHHGEKEDITVYWKAEVVDGKKTIYEYGNNVDCGNPEKGKPVRVLHENGGEYSLDHPVWAAPLFVYIGEVQGPHSGGEDCVMRYSISNAYRGAPGTRYSVLWVPQEVVGQGLCNLPSGTGVNKAGRKPFPRYGDATQGKGACAHKICVNDLYH